MKLAQHNLLSNAFKRLRNCLFLTLMLSAAPAIAAATTPVVLQLSSQPAVSFQNGQVVIQWQTNSMADSRLLFGTSAQALNARAGDIQYTRQHQVIMGGLTFGQRYFYRIESTNPAGQKVQSALFEFTAPAAATLNLNIEGAGKIEGPNLNCQGQCTSHYATGKHITLVATPSAGQQFAGWSSGCEHITQNRCTLQLNSNISVAAIFVAEDAPTVTPEFSVESQQPLLRGTGAAPGQQINLYANNILIGTVYADENGSWQFWLTNLTPGSYQISYRYVVSGKETSASPGLNIKINAKKRSKLLLRIIPYLQ